DDVSRVAGATTTRVGARARAHRALDAAAVALRLRHRRTRLPAPLPPGCRAPIRAHLLRQLVGPSLRRGRATSQSGLSSLPRIWTLLGARKVSVASLREPGTE